MGDEQVPANFGHYWILHEIARGGMGVVYEGEHVKTRERVALKTMLKASAFSLASFRHEIHSLRRVSHPGIVHIVDDGVINGIPWVAMPFLRGRTLSHYLKDFWEKPVRFSSEVIDETLPMTSPGGDPARIIVASAPSAPGEPIPSLARTLTLIRRLCVPLAYLHGEGLVHRDLKPGNVILQEGDRPVLIDLGLAVHRGVSGREELGIDSIAGTACYMAPEQFRGDLIDARADLYALGCILYECVTGRPPFSGSWREVERQHLHDMPLKPSLLVPGLPPRLDDLILRLLEKHPQDRIGYAADIAAELIALGAAAEPDDGPPPLVHLYNPGLIGRTDDLAMLEDRVDTVALRRRGGLVLVRGESGVGKTRLVMEIGRNAAKRLAVFTGICMAPGAGEVGATAAVASPLHPLRSVLIAAADLVGGSVEEANRLFGPRGKVLSAYFPELMNLPGQVGQPEPASLSPEKARQRVITSLRETLWALAESRPILIVLDDLQWADDLTLSLLEALVKANSANRGVLIVATYRSEETRPELEDLARLPGVTTISLGRLDRPSISEVVSRMLAKSTVPEGVIDALVACSNGNPFFVAEYLRAAIRAGILWRDDQGHFCFDAHGADEALASLALPTNLATLISRRLDQLDAAGQDLAAWAAVLAQEIDENLLRAGDQRDDAFTEALDALMARQILEETETGGLRFAHDKIREIAYQRLDEAVRTDLHRRAGEALEARYTSMLDKAAVLGHHFVRAGLHAKGGRYFVRAADRARRLYTNADAVRLYQAAIEALTRVSVDRTELAPLYEHLGDVLGLIGQQEQARDAYLMTIVMTSPSARLALAVLHRKVGKTWEMRHQHAEALALYTQAEDSLGPIPPSNPLSGERPIPRSLSDYAELWWQEWLQIKLDRISVHYWLADLKSLRALIELIRPVVERRGTALQLGHYFHALTQRNLQSEHFVPSARTVSYARKSVAAYGAAGESPEGHWGSSARFTLAFTLMLHGSLGEAEEQMNAALLIGEKSSDLEVQSRCLAYLTMIHRKQGWSASAEHLAQRSLSLAKAERVHEYAGAALGTLSWIALSRSDYPEAERAGREALAYWAPLALVYPFQWLARLPLCCAALAQDRLHDAFEQARAVLDPLQQRLPKWLANGLEKAISLFEAGREVEAARVLLKVLQSALKRNFA